MHVCVFAKWYELNAYIQVQTCLDVESLLTFLICYFTEMRWGGGEGVQRQYECTSFQCLQQLFLNLLSFCASFVYRRQKPISKWQVQEHWTEISILDVVTLLWWIYIITRPDMQKEYTNMFTPNGKKSQVTFKLKLEKCHREEHVVHGQVATAPPSPHQQKSPRLTTQIMDDFQGRGPGVALHSHLVERGGKHLQLIGSTFLPV